MVTPSKIQSLSDNIESIYQHMVDELLINIGRHITSPTWTHTASWEIQKLAELGQLTQENAAIINGWIKQMPDAIRQTMEATRAAALDRLEKQLEQAAKDGYITPPVTDRTVQILRDYQEQAASVYNMVNTTMLQSSVDQYVKGINITDAEYGKLLAKKEATNEILDEAAGNIATGAETRQQAIRRAILRISNEGLTGFIDKAGRNWTPEAYVNMVTRTTVHNVAIESTKARMQDYNTQVFQVSSHAAARPLCYPYQGKFYSWDNTAGEIELGNGSSVRYEPLNSTTYGQAAGLFGINCGHFPIPIIPGVTIPHGEDNIQPKEENDREYKESQEQRALEREIREAKRNVEMLGDAATKEDKQKVRELQAKMREFTERTGRARRYDRESIVTAKQAAKIPPAPAKVVPAQPQKKAESEVVKRAENYGIAKLDTKKLDRELTKDEIIARVCGGDKTKGSCASLAWTYIGNRAGVDVLDFRGGKSQDWFSLRSTSKSISKLDGVKGTIFYEKNDFVAAHKALKTLEIGKEYYLAIGRHAAIIRKTAEDAYEYLELQSAYNNGWFPLNDSRFKNRFGCQKSHSWAGNKYAIDTILVESETLYENVDFLELLKYINTEEEKQKKGKTGGEK